MIKGKPGYLRLNHQENKIKYALVTADGKLIDKFRELTVARQTLKTYEKEYFFSDLKIIPIEDLKR